eukprot:9521588-Alexandrium_andersonii.AAC.1
MKDSIGTHSGEQSSMDAYIGADSDEKDAMKGRIGTDSGGQESMDAYIGADPDEKKDSDEYR